MPRLKWVWIELGRQVRQLRAAAASSGRVAGLGHEARNDAVECQSVIELVLHQRLELGHSLRRPVRVKLDRDLAVLRGENDGVVGVLGRPGGRNGEEGKRERDASAASKHEEILETSAAPDRGARLDSRLKWHCNPRPPRAASDRRHGCGNFALSRLGALIVYSRLSFQTPIGTPSDMSRACLALAAFTALIASTAPAKRGPAPVTRQCDYRGEGKLGPLIVAYDEAAHLVRVTSADGRLWLYQDGAIGRLGPAIARRRSRTGPAIRHRAGGPGGGRLPLARRRHDRPSGLF